MGRLAVLTGLVAVCLSACSQALPPLTHPAFSEQRWKLDDSECARNATLVRGDRSSLTRLFGRSDTENQVYYRCMVSRGYRPTIKGLSRPVPRRDTPHVEETTPPGERAEPAESPAPGELADPSRPVATPDAADATKPSPRIRPDEVQDSTKSPEVAEPADSTDSTAPADSPEPVDSAEPTESTEPTVPEEPTESAESTDQQVDKQIETNDPAEDADSMAIEGTESIGESEPTRQGEAREEVESR